MSAWGTAVGLASGLAAISLVCWSTVSMIASRSLPPNGLMGLRTRATRRSSQAWYVGHDAARPALQLVTKAGAAGVVLLLAGALFDREAVVLVVGLVAYAGVVALAARAAVVADRAARRVGDA